ncbi:ribose 5-phosphate isomerase B [Rubinisphaera sp.]|uniref:ribose 5-phosphate isomerase B n=1 Tax=Rubinisphaera sp. TaxID=2024857 RepID=UPI000C10E8C2|nr:ribose 5-phosphate isomerase B [Rubinisphaera sp.]MBV10967.1 ribose 5-phosphate isomerase B [Rubinisphaera sp.]HCS55766.1 ribose 5-phosphate isomerase B [Planctomycetaceae bacterium]|tara:strand:- start:15709 stop:16197 length:489 start_codon:yes stop_codon:yes gene_type:complete
MDALACQSIAIGGDHAGFLMKSELAEYLSTISVQFIDCGTHDVSPADFPLYAEKVSELILAGKVERGVLVCGSGVGVSVAANKIPGIRASLCHDSYSARQGVEHDDMNVLCLGARVIGPSLAFEVVKAFLQAKYTPQPRHQKRVDMINAIEKKALDGGYSAT